MTRAIRCLSAELVVVALTGGRAEADTIIATFDKNHYPINPVNTFGASSLALFLLGLGGLARLRRRLGTTAASS